MATASLSLAIALSLIDQSVAAYHDLLRDHPLDWGEEAARRQQEAADLLDRAQTLRAALTREELPTFSERFSNAYETIERLETLRAQIGYDPEEDEDEDEDVDADARVTLAIRLVGGPLNGQTRNLELQASDGDANRSAPRQVQVPHVVGSGVAMATYLRDTEPSWGESIYFYVDAPDPARA